MDKALQAILDNYEDGRVADRIVNLILKHRAKAAQAALDKKKKPPRRKRHYQDVEEAKSEKHLRALYAKQRHKWPRVALGAGTCSHRGRHKPEAQRSSIEEWSEFGPPGVIWHAFGERSFEREMKIPWKRV